MIAIFIFGFALFKVESANKFTSSAEPRPCEFDWLQFSDSCYQAFHGDQKSWDLAKQACEEFNAHLVTFTTKEENQAVYKKLAVGKSLWIGLKRNPLSVFEWITGEQMTYTNWIGSGPTDINEKCGEMTDYGSFNGMWNDNSCDHQQGYICEKATRPLKGIYTLTNDKALLGHVLKVFVTSGDFECLQMCVRTAGCFSVNYHHSSSPGLCELNDVTATEYPHDLLNTPGITYYGEP
ncbi:collectin-12 [Nematostella vectensis]|uniref:collectin-12 n=1 Tax=Nematostella vectensis TaxID=45351 RepID=UPI0020771E10|nr:collectin-12 [Nematostella vectensis]